MTNEELLDALCQLGIDEESFRVIALLPLVHVAWADGEVQVGEREVIQRVARENGFLSGDGARVLKEWLSLTPTTDYVERGHAVLRALCEPEQEDRATLGRDTVELVVGYCEEVAAAAGGVFGLLFTVDERERKAIREIAEALHGRGEAL